MEGGRARPVSVLGILTSSIGNPSALASVTSGHLSSLVLLMPTQRNSSSTPSPRFMVRLRKCAAPPVYIWKTELKLFRVGTKAVNDGQLSKS